MDIHSVSHISVYYFLPDYHSVKVNLRILDNFSKSEYNNNKMIGFD